MYVGTMPHDQICLQRSSLGSCIKCCLGRVWGLPPSIDLGLLRLIRRGTAFFFQEIFGRKLECLWGGEGRWGNFPSKISLD